ncbi:DUF6134 family protein [Fodinicurvata sediminis]|uniref:DUF6134 family protein n=1 Tax=Fodinicurvata sediminis TaxID=1121832 RepID=UPI0003B72695|nr:DUF6134 family protein [Fodinicurvata sediminis]
MKQATAGARRWGGLALMLTLVVAPVFAAIPEENTLDFQVRRDGNDIGTHSLRFEEHGEELHVFVEIELEVNLAFIPVYSYSHRNHEVWQDGKLVSLSSETDDDGTQYQVEVQATDDGLQVNSSEEGEFTAPADMLTTSYWNPDAMERERLLDTQFGRIVELQVDEQGRENLDTQEGSVEATRYSVTGDLNLDIWYDREGRWSGLEFEARGKPVRYLRTPLSSAGVDGRSGT